MSIYDKLFMGFSGILFYPKLAETVNIQSQQYRVLSQSYFTRVAEKDNFYFYPVEVVSLPRPDTSNW